MEVATTAHRDTTCMWIKQEHSNSEKDPPRGKQTQPLPAIQETFCSELVAAVGGMKNDVRNLAGRMDQVEGQMTTKLQQTISLLDDMTNKYYKQDNILQQMQEADREFDERLRRLEQKGVGSEADPSGGSTTDTGR